MYTPLGDGEVDVFLCLEDLDEDERFVSEVLDVVTRGDGENSGVASLEVKGSGGLGEVVIVAE